MSIKISQLSASVAVTGSNLIATVIDSSGSLITTKATISQVFDYITSSITDLTLNNITVLDNTILGSSSVDTLIVNATSQFNADLTASNINIGGNLEVSGNSLLNTITSSNITGSNAEFTSVTASFSGDGFNLSNIPNAALQNSSITIGTTTISLGDTTTVLQGLTEITASGARFDGDVFINGTASIVQLNTLNEQSLVVGDKYITILSGAADHISLDGSGILWGSGTADLTTDDLGAAAHLRYVESFDKLRVFPGLYVSGALTASAELSGTSAHFNLLHSVDVSGNVASFGIITGSFVSGNIAHFNEVTASFSGSGLHIIDITASNITNFTNDVRDQFIAGTNITIVGGVISSTGGGGPGTGSFSTAVNLITGNLTLDDSYHTIYADATSGSITVTLPLAATYNGVEFIIKKVDTSTTTVVTVSGSSGELIDGLTHIPLDYRFEGITVQSDGTSSWFVNSDVSSEVTLIAQGYINPVGSNALYILTGTAAGADDSTVQFNNSGLLSGSNQLTYNYINGILSGTVAKFTAITASSLTNAKLNNLTTNVALLSSNTTLNSDQHVILASASLSNLFITLPSCSNSEHRQYIIKKVDSNAFKIIISGSGGELIDGIDGREINTQYETLTLVSNGISEWFIL